MKNPLKHTPDAMRRSAAFCIIALSIVAIAGLLLHGPISQDQVYHNFADDRALFNVSNFWNVVSNIPFVLIGILGLLKCKALQGCPSWDENRTGYILFFIGALFTGLSSAYYHLHPTNWSLFWDRLSMALTFMAFLSIIIGAFISTGLSKQLTAPLVLFGLFSVIFWIVTEQYGAGDLRLYALTQFLPVSIISVIILSRESEYIKISDVIIIGAGYGIAKLLEFLDAPIHQYIMISGHSLKHLAAAFSVYWVLNIAGRHQCGSTSNHKV